MLYKRLILTTGIILVSSMINTASLMAAEHPAVVAKPTLTISVTPVSLETASPAADSPSKANYGAIQAVASAEPAAIISPSTTLPPPDNKFMRCWLSCWDNVYYVMDGAWVWVHDLSLIGGGIWGTLSAAGVSGAAATGVYGIPILAAVAFAAPKLQATGEARRKAILAAEQHLRANTPANRA